MSTSSVAPARAAGHKAAWLRAARWAALIGALAVLASGLYWFAPQWQSLVGIQEAETASQSAADTPPTESRLEVILPPEKLAAAAIVIGHAQTRQLAGTRTVPGKVEYNHNKHLELRSPASGVVREVLVNPGQQVRAGEELVLLSSSEIGLARDQVLAQQSELEISQRELAFRELTASNLKELLATLRDDPPLAEVEQQFAGRKLGEYRETILGAYSKLKLAEKVVSESSSLAGQGIISGRLGDERRSAREVAAAAFQAASEQAQFAAEQQRDRAAASVAQNERLLKVNEQALVVLLGPFADHSPVMGESPLSDFTLRAPFDARVESRDISQSERVTPGQQLFVLANNTSLWVSAEIHERDWQLLEIHPGQEVTITSPALPGREFAARVHHVGAVVSPQTHAVPLVAELENPEGLFKPGMFAWVNIAHERVDSRIVVPIDAVAHNADETFVFVPVSGTMFRRVDVETGLETPEWIEITKGLASGDALVTEGAFFLKSELLLEHEE
jgi:cobalt-zinc-cadmium efflux system membrane fusion protein